MFQLFIEGTMLSLVLLRWCLTPKAPRVNETSMRVEWPDLRWVVLSNSHAHGQTRMGVHETLHKIEGARESMRVHKSWLSSENEGLNSHQPSSNFVLVLFRFSDRVIFNLIFSTESCMVQITFSQLNCTKFSVIQVYACTTYFR